MLQVKEITYSYNDTPTIENLSLSIPQGTILGVIGESGCGKSTLLKLLYGLYDLDEGQIFWKDTEVLGPKYNLIPGMDFMKYLAQDFDLMPYITVAENVGKYLSNRNPEAKKKRIAELLKSVDMTEFAHVKAKTLSGGQMQRVALAKTLALAPEVLLLDEPFSHIDAFRKNSLRRSLFAYIKEKQITCIMATHDSTDVLSFADTLAVMKDGKLIDFGTPKAIYEHPKDHYTAALFGDVNVIQTSTQTHYRYPHQIRLNPQAPTKATVLQSYFRGTSYLIEAQVAQTTIFFEAQDALLPNTVVGIEVEGM
ncbi:ABC transporter ATP-binding protein [Flavobacterium aciduliphilum]|uniref:ABC-type Fe3+/spermidine/putrescine transport system ATPase subunit n=1 Tax=Flavobacterium aciduliphilum TaxID=1101402 RepID=A0A328YNP7_9FLAO|nr:ABC transporter ATP-binding protein [Flavobacterium aciduliphilum]RAR75671.1 ABC-type Fe3+/spermidine/putrescine transport system ATPase subunit [Flavobacterium aciduliphilum]